MIVQIGTDIVEIEKLKYSVTKEPFIRPFYPAHFYRKRNPACTFTV